MPSVRYLMVVALCALMSSACVREIDHVVDIDIRSYTKAVSVEYDNQDTVLSRSIYLILRTHRTFDRDKVDLSIETVSPDTVSFSEYFTVYVPVCESNDTYMETIVAYRRNAVLNKRGKYIFRFSPGGETVGVEGVAGVGLKMVHGEE